jgi:hypothetical protein
MAATLIYQLQYFDADGAPLAHGKLYAFQAGTSTPATIYSNTALSSAYAIPLVLDASGRASGQMYQAAGSYDYLMNDADDVAVWTASAVPTLDAVTS